MIVLYLILAVLVLFVAALFINMAVQTSKARKLTGEGTQFDEDELQRYALRLQEMIRCKTVSVKGSYDDEEFAKLRDVVEKLFPLVHQRAERMIFSDDCWIYRIKGADESRSIMLMSHHDVVPVEGQWKYDGFSGEIAEGKIWGRGTVDTKTPLFAEFSALEELLAEGYEPPCNVYIGSSHNEELGGDGIPTAAAYFKEHGITFELVLDEGGAVIMPPMAGMSCEKCAMVAVHEKGRYYLNCTATAAHGHAGLTAATKANPVERMSAFVHEISTGDVFVRQLNPQVMAMFRHVAPYCKLPMRLLFTNLWCFSGLLKRILPKVSPQAGSLIGTTCTFSNIEGTGKKCSATAFLRPVNGADLERDLEAFRAVAAKYEIQVELAEGCEYHEPADMSRPQFAYTMDCIAKIFPQYPAVPTILPAGTDARTLSELCPCVLRFAPIRLSVRQLASVHGENENIDLDAVAHSVEFYKYLLKHYR